MCRSPLRTRPKPSSPPGQHNQGYRKLVVGRNTWRIVYRIIDDKSVEICEVRAVGARADEEVYAEATARVNAAGGNQPELVTLAQVIDRLGRLAGDISVAAPASREPVPAWLANRLIHKTGMASEDVAALDLQEAVDLWTDFMSKPRPNE